MIRTLMAAGTNLPEAASTVVVLWTNCILLVAMLCRPNPYACLLMVRTLPMRASTTLAIALAFFFAARNALSRVSACT